MIEQMTKQLATTANDKSNLLIARPDQQRSDEAAYSAADELRTVIEAIFSGETGIHLLQANLPHRQV